MPSFRIPRPHIALVERRRKTRLLPRAREVMRVSYQRQQPGAHAEVPEFLRSDFAAGSWERTGFDVDFPVIAKEPMVAAAMGSVGTNFLADCVNITRWYNRDTKVIAGGVIFSGGCEGPPGVVHGGAVAAALDDILGTMVWREVGFSRTGIPTLELTVRYRNPTPLRRQLRFDTHLIKREGRKVFAKAEIRDPASDKLLAEGAGLFYMKKSPESTTKAALHAPGRPANEQAVEGAAPTTGASRPPRPEMIPYDEAIQQFGAGNSAAAANIVGFYGVDMTALPRAKL